MIHGVRSEEVPQFQTEISLASDNDKDAGAYTDSHDNVLVTVCLNNFVNISSSSSDFGFGLVC